MIPLMTYTIGSIQTTLTLIKRPTNDGFMIHTNNELLKALDSGLEVEKERMKRERVVLE